MAEPANTYNSLQEGASAEPGRAGLRGVDLVKAYGRRRVVDRVSFYIDPGQIVGLLGPNGAGKTTTFYMVVGLVHADGGQVFLGDREVTRTPMYRRARTGISYLPQEPSIFRKLTVEENILAILETMGLSKSAQRQRLNELLTDLGIDHLAKSKAYALSGGERRRVEISRALATRPAFLLLDEPFAGIDPLIVIELQHIILRLKERRIGILISDHNVRETLGVCDRAYILNDGVVIEEGPPQKIAASDIARKFYLGDNFTL
jgi:lipopolysaccharide export system ATP-binding protein